MKMPVILRLTTHVCHAKEKVIFDAWQPLEFDKTPRFDPENGPYVPIAADVFPMKAKALKKLEKVAVEMNRSPLNSLFNNGNKARG
ncbi:indolepyruvate ferredoxin oxidoreductase, partial [Desulfobacteraceae bacterium SEEP-SAG9]